MTLTRTKCAVIGSKLKLELSALIKTVQLKICYHNLALNLVSSNSSRFNIMDNHVFRGTSLSHYIHVISNVLMLVQECIIVNNKIF